MSALDAFALLRSKREGILDLHIDSFTVEAFGTDRASSSARRRNRVRNKKKQPEEPEVKIRKRHTNVNKLRSSHVLSLFSDKPRWFQNPSSHHIFVGFAYVSFIFDFLCLCGVECDGDHEPRKHPFTLATNGTFSEIENGIGRGGSCGEWNEVHECINTTIQQKEISIFYHYVAALALETCKFSFYLI